MSLQSSMSPTKRLTFARFTIPASAPLHSLDVNIDVTLPRSASYESISEKLSTSETKNGETGLKSSFCPVTISQTSEPERTHQSAPKSRPRSGSASAWSPGLLRRLRWRARRCTLWNGLVFCAFVVATVVFFSALFGVGYVPEEPEHVRFASGWRAPGPGVLSHGRGPHMSASGLLESFLLFSGFGASNTVKPEVAEDVSLEEEGDDASEPMSTRTGARGHGRPHFGAWHQTRRRMSVVHEPSISPPHTDQDRRRRPRLPWIEPSPPEPFHGPFHKRISQLAVSSEASQEGSDAYNEQDETLWGRDEDEYMEQMDLVEDAETQGD